MKPSKKVYVLSVVCTLLVLFLMMYSSGSETKTIDGIPGRLIDNKSPR